jgi:hypothetical protein
MPAGDSDEFLRDVSYREGAAAGLSHSSLDADPTLQFFDCVRGAIVASLDRALPASDTPPAVFVRSDSARLEASKMGSATRIIDIDEKTVTEWAGQIHIVAPNGTSGWRLPLNGTVESAFDRLETAGLGHSPICIVYPADRMVSCFKEGAEDTQNAVRFRLPVTSRQVTMQALIEVIDEHRRHSLISPQVCPPDFWSNPQHHLPALAAEKHIQWGVAVALRNSFRPITADVEQITPTGRIDICMTNPQPGGPVHPAVIELKALRSKTSTGLPVSRRRNLLWMASGYRQAKAYREDKHAILGLLACFDMRADQDNLMAERVIELAKNKYFDDNMAARIFKIHGRPEAAQEEIATVDKTLVT